MGHTQLQLGRGSNSQVGSYTGPQGEMVLSTDDWALVVQDGATAGGIARVRPGPNYQFPSGSSSYTATVADGGKVLSSYNTTSSALTVTLPAYSTLTDGWSMAFITDNGKGMIINTAGGGQNILIPGVGAVGGITLAHGDYEYVKLEYDGGASNCRLVSATPATWSALGARGAGANYSYQQPTTGTTLTAPAALGAYVIDPAGTIASLTVVMPPSAADGQLFELSTSQAISSLTVSPAAGQTVRGGSMLLTANGGAGWRYRSANSTWYRRF